MEGRWGNFVTNDLGKHWWPRLFAELEADEGDRAVIAQADGSAPGILDIARGLVHNAPLGEGRAVGYAYFSPPGIARFLTRWPQHAGGEDWTTAARAVLDGAPELAGQDCFTGLGTENHWILLRAGGYLVAEAVRERGAGDASTGFCFDEAVRWSERLAEVFTERAKVLYERGTGEWDSSIYYPYAVSGWLQLHDLARDPAVREAARAVLDWIALTGAHRALGGIPGGPEQRGTSAHGQAGSALAGLHWLWHGEGAEPDWTAGPYWSPLVYAALSDYAPPEAARALARHEPEAVEQTFEQKPSYLLHGTEAVRAESGIVFARGRGWTMGTAVRRPTGGWGGGDAQEILWRLCARDPGEVRVVQSPPGRPPWVQAAQERGLAVMMAWRPCETEAMAREVERIFADWADRWEEDFRARCPHDALCANPVRFRSPGPAAWTLALEATGLEESLVQLCEDAVVLDLGPFALVVRAAGAPFELRGEHGEWQLRSEAPEGGFAAWALEVGEKKTGAPLAPLAEGLQFDASRLDEGIVRAHGHEGFAMEMAFTTGGTFVEPEFDWGYGPREPGALVQPARPPLHFPQWPQGEGHDRVPAVRVDGKAQEWPDALTVYEGPFLRQRAGTVEVKAGGVRSTLAFPPAST